MTTDGVIPEVAAAQRAGSLLRRFVVSPYLTDEFWTEVGGKCVASRAALRVLFDELDADPRRLGERDKVLRQDRTAEIDDYDLLLEEAAWHKQQWAECCDAAESLRRRERVAEFDVDAREVDREDDRLREQRQDEAARQDAPRFAS